MATGSLKHAALLMVICVVAALLTWELYLRSTGANISYDSNSALWAHQRSQVYEPVDESTVFIGSSRIQFDLDMDTWESLTGEKPVQLAWGGSSPLPQLYHLADDPMFKGKLIIDVTEILFFSLSPGAVEWPDKSIDYYDEITPAQRASFTLNKPLESGLVFLDRDNYSINAMLDQLDVQSRPGVFMFPIFPRDFERVTFQRQSYMMPAFVLDTVQHNQVKAIWQFFASLDKSPPLSGAPLDSLLETVKQATDKIKARGGKVLFVRTPSSGPFWAGEQQGYPREKYWDRLLSYTNTPGIHFMDDEATNHYVCPEYSHLTPQDAIHYTKHFIRILHDQQGWTFPIRQI